MTLIHNEKLIRSMRMAQPRPPLRRSAVANPAQIIRAVVLGLLFGIVFLWAMPQSHILFAADETPGMTTLV
jgi:hypothetical protein